MRTILASGLLAASVVFAVTTSAPAEEPDPKFYVFLCLGQSSMEGFPRIEEQDRTEAERFKVLAAVDFPKLGRKKGNWYPAVAPLCRGSSGLCPADYFGRALAAHLPKDIKVGVVNVSVAGCKIELFDKANKVAEAKQPEPPGPTTYCNPLSLPNYPLGRRARDATVGAPVPKDDWLWLVGKQQQFRELADVSVLWHEGAWYLYPSVDMAWVSKDGGATWQHHPLNVRDVGYAPTVVKHKGKFLLMASESPVYAADSPLGPFKEIGPIKLPAGVPGQVDPMLFSDDDGRLFYYWGCTPTEGIFGVELDADDPTRVVGKPVRVIAFEPDKQPWQRLGDWNEQPARGWVEGAWMLKRNGKYYLTYAAAGTENRTYATGCAVGKSPLGPFVPQKNNPVLRTTTGLVTGTAHGCVVEGPHNSLWAFYTVKAAVVHGFERRLGMDPAYVGEDGELHVSAASSLPQRLPTASKGAGPTGWLPLNAGPRTVGSSDAPNLSGRLAVDDDLRTWWQPAADDKAPALTSNLTTPGAVVRAVRVVWRDVGLNTKQGAKAGAFRYKVEVRTAGNTWATVIDRSQSTDDLLIDYRECPATPGTAARLVVVGAPPGITPGVAEFTVFGEVRSQRGPTIKDVYKNHFLIGTAGDIPGNYSDEELDLVKGHFGIVTPENCMKPGPVHPGEDKWSFDRPDALEVVRREQDRRPRPYPGVARPDEQLVLHRRRQGGRHPGRAHYEPLTG